MLIQMCLHHDPRSALPILGLQSFTKKKNTLKNIHMNNNLRVQYALMCKYFFFIESSQGWVTKEV